MTEQFLSPRTHPGDARDFSDVLGIPRVFTYYKEGKNKSCLGNSFALN